MTEPTATEQLPPLYEGHGLPVDKLDPGKFEDFVFACLFQVAATWNLRIDGKPSGSGDGGFDVMGESLPTHRKSCVQCKRQQNSLGFSQVAEELAKVAATSKLEGSDVGEHRFICTGGIAAKLHRALRQNARTDLAAAAGERIVSAEDGPLVSLRQRLEAAGHDVRRVAEYYVQNLDTLVAWSFHEFDVALSAQWDVILPVVERHFRVAAVVREHPRAQFERSAYVSEHLKFQVPTDPRLLDGPLPVGLPTASAEDPVAQEAAPSRRMARVAQLAELTPGELVILVGEGGAGKTVVLNLIRAVALRNEPESALPIVISLTTYSPGQLGRAIHRELGVTHGNWQSLPDRILLLCDGLNECSAQAASSLLDEIKPLLRRKQLGCIISSRGDMGRARIPLPQVPAACVHLDALTPMGIRRIAEHKLDEYAAPLFIAAYRTLTDRARTRLFWTPFAVRVAIRLWRHDSSLPESMGGMLQRMLELRGQRHSERGSANLSPEATTELARALAFEALVVDKRLEYSENEAGAWIRRAKQRCSDTLGISDLTEREAIDSLLSYELLRRTDTGYYAFQHHIVAGALAAPFLAKVWRNHAASLQDTVSDDAWIYAGPFVEAAQRADFLNAIFDRDIQLGARVASEIPEVWQHAQELLDRCVAPESAEVLRIHGIFALGHLGGTQSIAKLRAMKTRPGELLTHPINMALAFAGDEDYLKTLLPEVDEHRSGGVTVAGGVMPIWDSAPIPVRLDLARIRLNECAPGSPVGETLRLVGFERDTSDVALIESHLQGARHIFAWQAALAALQGVDPARAKAATDSALSSPAATAIDRARIMRVAAGASIDVDIHEAFRCAITEVPDGNTAELYMLIHDVIDQGSLPPDLAHALEKELPHSSGDRRQRLWQLAQECHSEVIANYAASRLEAWDNDAPAACYFFIAQTDLARSRREQLVEACEKALDIPFGVTNGALPTVLRLLAQLGFTAKAAEALSATIERLVRVGEAARRNEFDTLSAEDLAVFGNGQRDNPSIVLSILASQLVPIVATVRKRLPANIPLLLLHFDFTSSSAAVEMRSALSGHTDESIDRVLQQIDDMWITVSGLSIVCPRGATEVRVRLLESALRQYYGHPAAMHTLTRAVEACWSGAVLEMVLRTVPQIPRWTEYEAQFFGDFIRMVAQRIQPENGPAIERAIAEAQTGPAQRVLSVWQTEALGRRIGLGTELRPTPAAAPAPPA
jgi:hypothetical protein